MKTIIESPYAGDVKLNLLYLKKCCRDSVNRGEYPFASHLFYTQFLDDDIPEERKLGIEAGYRWMSQADQVVVYIDLGISGGMQFGIERAESLNLPVSYRSLLTGQEYVDAIMKAPDHKRQQTLDVFKNAVTKILKVQLDAAEDVQGKMNDSMEKFGFGRPVKIELK